MWMAQQLSCPFLQTPKFPFPASASCSSIWPSHVSFRPPYPQSSFSGFSGFKLALFILLSVNMYVHYRPWGPKLSLSSIRTLRPKVWSTISPVRPCISPQDKQTDEWKSLCVPKDFVPFQTAARLPLTPIYNHAKQDNGYRWPHIALGQPVNE